MVGEAVVEGTGIGCEGQNIASAGIKSLLWRVRQGSLVVHWRVGGRVWVVVSWRAVVVDVVVGGVVVDGGRLHVGDGS